MPRSGPRLPAKRRRIADLLINKKPHWPADPGWIHEIEHDGFRILAELDSGRVRLITRKGFDLAQRFPRREGDCLASRSSSRDNTMPALLLTPVV